MEKYTSIINRIRIILDKKGVQGAIDTLHEEIHHYNWVGIYIVKNTMLHLGPWAGPYATEHTTIPIGKGICGYAAKTGKTEIISDVKADNRYLSCFLSTKSEIVVPIRYNQEIIGEIDVDSDQQDAFTTDDERFLEIVADMLGPHIRKL